MLQLLDLIHRDAKGVHGKEHCFVFDLVVLQRIFASFLQPPPAEACEFFTLQPLDLFISPLPGGLCGLSLSLFDLFRSDALNVRARCAFALQLQSHM